jgi:hypothetical protein
MLQNKIREAKTTALLIIFLTLCQKDYVKGLAKPGGNIQRKEVVENGENYSQGF